MFLRERWLPVTLVLAALLAAVAWWTYAYVLPRTLVRVSDVEATIAAQLPRGSSESEAVEYLRLHGYKGSAVLPVTNNDGFLRAQGVPIGTQVLSGEVGPGRRHWFAESSRITIWIVFDAGEHVDRTYVSED